jgi:hypothetical protein
MLVTKNAHIIPNGIATNKLPSNNENTNDPALIRHPINIMKTNAPISLNLS